MFSKVDRDCEERERETLSRPENLNLKVEACPELERCRNDEKLETAKYRKFSVEGEYIVHL